VGVGFMGEAEMGWGEVVLELGLECEGMEEVDGGVVLVEREREGVCMLMFISSRSW
jgi:hypothetical protein